MRRFKSNKLIILPSHFSSFCRLPKKEAELFKTIVKSYESKQYKKGIKTAETILKKFPTNGETLAMKGLILNSIGKKEDAHENVKLGLRYNVRSHICWHVYGLVHRSDNNYKEASKCYLNALRIDCDNQNILRDLSWLQMQVLLIDGLSTMVITDIIMCYFRRAMSRDS